MIKQTIKKIEEEIEKIEKSFSERDSLGDVWTKKNSKWCGLKEKLSGYKLALKDVLSEIDDFFNEEKYTTEQDLDDEDFIRVYWKDIEELKKPIQEILKDRIEVLK